MKTILLFLLLTSLIQASPLLNKSPLDAQKIWGRWNYVRDESFGSVYLFGGYSIETNVSLEIQRARTLRSFRDTPIHLRPRLGDKGKWTPWTPEEVKAFVTLIAGEQPWKSTADGAISEDGLVRFRYVAKEDPNRRLEYAELVVELVSFKGINAFQNR